MLNNKIVLITGASKGMGASHARICAAYGAVVVLADLDPAGHEVAEIINVSGGCAVFYELDVSCSSSWRSLIEKVIADYGRLDGLVNNAGVVLSKSVEEITAQELDLIIDVNIKGTFFGCQHALPALKLSKAGVIVNISSISGVVANLPGLSAYCATKGAVRLFTKAVAVDYAGYGIRVNSVHPGTIETPMVAKYLEDAEAEKLLVNASILKRVGQASEVSEAVAFLLSDKSSYMTGAELVVDGGVTAQ
ncbi:glucose 1-dehydrogenase [Pseudomonas sp. Teo4]|uniref:SDR family NAD(P)-dependent oxidoreductase n=1 Tax=Pseudomonas sp. Teo4 TaxID=3064528 RepID=UPI002ABA0CE9|nr:glucose 1-dehydrogenase [Pseudomonas sp. Teo4]MDZ3992629.1 Cyclopentanol dehydrogenase [Pseudomonas sp. Teo4]